MATAPTSSGSCMGPTMRPAPRHSDYPRPNPVTVVARALGRTPATAKAYLTLSHPKSPLGTVRALLAALVVGGHPDRAAAIYEELGVALVPPLPRDLDELDALEQELDGREDEAQLLRRIQHEANSPSRARSWATERRLRLRYGAVNREIVATGDALFGGRCL